MQKWYNEVTDSSDVVVSSRVRLARNLAKYNFQERLDDESASKLIEQVRGLTPELERGDKHKYHTCCVSRLSELEREYMVEWHIISPALAKKKQETGLVLSDDDSISIMLNEEDHIRLQSITGGMNMKKAWRAANEIDDILDGKLEYAYSSKYGYLTSCPTNVGTGLRASYMLFLPALSFSGKIDKLAGEVMKYGIVIRGIYGEGTKGEGFLYQVSNQKTLGCSERDIMENLTRIVMQIISQEKRYREQLLSVGKADLEDKVYRSYGVMKYAKQITVQDAMMLLAQLKLGMDLKLISLRGGDGLSVYAMMMELQRASLQRQLGKQTDDEQLNRFRAEYLRSKLPELSQ